MTVRGSDRFEGAYDGTPPWDIGRPQQAFLDTAGTWSGHVLDSGCGTGELAMAAAARGLRATGIDGAASAIAIARSRAAERGLEVEFVVGDVLRLGAIGHAYDLVFDSGVFHTFEPDERPLYVQSLTPVTNPGGRLLLLCFSDSQSGDWGPFRISRDELTSAFAGGWRIASIEPATFVLHSESGSPPTARAWFAQMSRQ
jgi:ubiquinone/menaquinone biosynthesis C-methylase UbiE